jgi:hypothetical protein
MGLPRSHRRHTQQHKEPSIARELLMSHMGIL